MSSTLSEGVRVPDIGSVNWGADVNFNWGLLNTALANISGNVKTDVANTWTATQTFSETISGSIDGVAARAVGDEDGTNIKTALAGKQSSLSQSQLDAVNSGITAAAVQQIGTNASNISALQTAVASKAADDAVVHLAGAETITGGKTWTGINAFTKPPVVESSVANNGIIYIKSPTLTFGTAPSATYTYALRYTDSAGAVIADFLAQAQANGINNLSLRVRNTDGTLVYDRRIFFNVNANGFTYFAPSVDSVHNLGTASNRWLTFNGINPGALGMIDTSSYVSIDTTDWSVSDVNRLYINGEDPGYPGWLYIRINNATTSDKLYIRFVSTAAANPAFTAAFMPDKYLILLAPCPPNTPIYVVLNSLPTTCRFYPCLGNV